MSSISIDVENMVIKVSEETLTPNKLYLNEDKSYEMSIALAEVKNTKMCDWLSGSEALVLWLLELPPKYDQISGALFVISKQSKQLIFRMNCPEGAWLGGRLSASSMFNAMQEYVYQKDLDIEITQKEGTIYIYFRIGDIEQNLGEYIQTQYDEIVSLTSKAEQLLEGFSWNSRYDSDEEFFTKDLIIPLLRKMRYKNVRYNHGTDEFGKDVIFSEPTPFKSPRHFAAQVKAGNVSGGAKGQIDEIISQINDIFTMPYKGPGQGKNFYVAEALVIISGKFTKNAVEKINQKIPSELRGSVRFLDRDDIETLVKLYWPF